MDKKHLDINRLNEIINATIESVEKGQKEIYNIAEYSKQECERLEKELSVVKEEVRKTINKVEYLEKAEKSARYKLMVVSRDIKKYSEEDIKKAYDDAKDIQIKLLLEKQRELQLRERRDELERSLKSMMTILKRAEHLTMQTSVALSFLKGNLESISGKLSDITQKQNFAASIIKAQEEERKRVARDIHDGPAQTMANCLIQIEICERLFDVDFERVKQEFKELKDIVRASINEMRKVIFNLRPSALDDLGLEAVARRYCAEFQEETGINSQCLIFGDNKRLESSMEVMLFRILQEALTNVRKHSMANNVTVKIEYLKDRVNMAIVDDGRGFDYDLLKDRMHSGHHLGIISIKERAQLFKGDVKIDTAPGRGTKVFVSVPLRVSDKEVW